MMTMTNVGIDLWRRRVASNGMAFTHEVEGVDGLLVLVLNHDLCLFTIQIVTTMNTCDDRHVPLEYVLYMKKVRRNLNVKHKLHRPQHTNKERY